MKKVLAALFFAGVIFYAQAERIDDIENAEQSGAHKMEKHQDSMIKKDEIVSEKKSHELENSMDAEIKNLEIEKEKKAQSGEVEDVEINKLPDNPVQIDDRTPLIPNQIEETIENDLDANESSNSPRQ